MQSKLAIKSPPTLRTVEIAAIFRALVGWQPSEHLLQGHWSGLTLVKANCTQGGFLTISMAVNATQLPQTQVDKQNK